MVKITTSSNLEGHQITSYIKPVASHVVIGMNFFKDILTSLTDFFGGESSSYKRVMDKVTQQAQNELMRKCAEAGGNYVIGYRIDFDEISGGGKQMLMVSASGTAVVAIQTTQATQPDKTQIQGSYLAQQIRIAQWEKTYTKTNINDALEFAFEHKVGSAAHGLLKMLCDSMYMPTDIETNETYQKACAYFAAIEPAQAADALVSGIVSGTENTESISHAIASKIPISVKPHLSMFVQKSDYTAIVKTAIVEEATYTPADIDRLGQLITTITQAFPVKAVYVEEKGFLSNKTSQKWQCTCRVKNSADSKYCAECNRDKYGYTRVELDIQTSLETLSTRYEILEKIFYSK